MRSEWSECRLADVINIKHGFAFKGEFFTDEQTPYQLTTPGNFSVGGGFRPGKGKYYSGPISNDYILRPGDVIVTMTDLSKAADTLGFAAFVPMTSGTTWLHNQRVGLVQIKPEAPIRPRYLQYLMRASDYRHWVVSTATGSTVKHTSPGRICEFAFALPSLREQNGIASVLGSLDDRIALLRETNATLEAIAQALFKSWFVDFDPVRAKLEGRVPEGMDEATAALFPDSFDESELGTVPKGWQIATLADAFDINPKRSLKKSVSAPYLDMASLSTSGHCVEAPIQRDMGSGAKFRNGDTLLARITPCLENGKAAFVDFLADDQIGWGSTEFLVLRPKKPLPEYFGYLLCRHPEFREYAIQSMSGTSGRQRVQNDVLGRYMLAVPDENVAFAFARVVEVIQKSIAVNHKTGRTLAALRDTLLPRLISGQLRLPEAETILEEAIA
ncbi:restriction endonuclease subunit S [Janthinobacterium sp. NFX145]|uniref:restriction endonuclease subunit S n=1 Tax=Janthinobacterium sp. NFX145 TaxID=3415602 RepID=UPI003CC63CA0